MPPQSAMEAVILHEMCFYLNISGNEVHYTIFKIFTVKIMPCSKLHCQKSFHMLLVKIMLCSKLHCQKSVRLKHISFKIGGGCACALRAAASLL